MLDSHARRYIQPLLNGLAAIANRAGCSAIGLTISGVLVGLLAALLVVLDQPLLAVAVLWLSGLIDAADGTLARMTNTSSPLGAILDITFDRVVEIAVIAALAWQYPQQQWLLLVLAGVIAIAMSLFLSIGAAIDNHSEKSFHYAPGLGERTEAFICLSIMILDAERLALWSSVFILVIVFTMWQRLRHLQQWLAQD